jgi:outer membrane lipoprotein-sorting protein
MAPFLLTSSAADLNNRIASIYNATHSFEATTEMTARTGSVYRSFNVTELTESFTAYILFRKAAAIRVLGKAPVFGTVFDMTSTGPDFKLSLPTKKLFFTGSDSVPAVSASALENLRPNALLAALLIRPVDLVTERMHLEDDTDVDHSWYILQLARKGPDDTDLPDRSVWFDRLDLRVIRQRIFDNDGLIVSDTKYDKWQLHDGVMFPTHIDASFKKDGYGVVINTSTVKMNSEPGDEKFVQEQPEGSTLRVLGGAKRR